MSEDYLFAEEAKKLGYTINLCMPIKLDHFGTHMWEGDFMKKIVLEAKPNEKTSVQEEHQVLQS
jgi:hypothetical protein